MAGVAEVLMCLVIGISDGDTLTAISVSASGSFDLEPVLNSRAPQCGRAVFEPKTHGVVVSDASQAAGGHCK